MIKNYTPKPLYIKLGLSGGLLTALLGHNETMGVVPSDPEGQGLCFREAGAAAEAKQPGEPSGVREVGSACSLWAASPGLFSFSLK